MKICKKCKENKNLIDFYKSKSYKDGYYTSCKKCESDRTLNYYNNNKEEQKSKRKKRYIKNHESELKKKREYDKKNREAVNKKARERYHNNIEYSKEYYINNKEIILERNKKWIENNKEYFKILNCENSKRWSKNNPHVVVWRQILYRTIKKFKKKKELTTNEMLGYSAMELKIHIESLFEIGMSWENWGEWHIDHIIPLCTFNKESPISEINSLTNLRPLWATDNLKRKKKG